MHIIYMYTYSSSLSSFPSYLPFTSLPTFFLHTICTDSSPLIIDFPSALFLLCNWTCYKIVFFRNI
ncbi:hypothetical protein FB567DRAFT_527911 [Paraphoma chrysanthemicola]|uniref:Uncharacterized protein n=1 Tax=Paraphoma chrysanthemicola TaxID=798071 RepID=A0A8K0R4J6_9PLEO|nr:hypothetical protein FB567DRAFT_527911 [Paraphoma chrysanthemicola]